jgi:hypothetical protein
MRASGNPAIDYDRFAARWEQDPILKKIVDRFDGQGVVLKTQVHQDQPEQGKPKPKELDKMAKRATAKAFK